MLRSIANPRTLGAARFVRQASAAATKPAAVSSTPLSVPTLRKLDTRWELMTEGERDELVSALTERQKADWKTLTPLEKQAAWYISYGEWGPRRPIHPKGEVARIVFGTLLGVAIAGGVFTLIRMSLPDKPKTMSREWETAADERLAAKNAEPFTGHSQIQSPYRGVHPTDDDDE